MTTILVTGGTGYIGSHTVTALIQNGYEVVIVDNLYNSSKAVLNRIETITGIMPKFYEMDILDRDGLDRVFAENSIDAVIHFAGYKAVGESVEKPLVYYENNISGSVNLYQAMVKAGCKTLVFSSSATVYGDPEKCPITEDSKVGGTTNPYGTSKLMNEHILEDVCVSDPDWSVMLLRYFNPIQVACWVKCRMVFQTILYLILPVLQMVRWNSCVYSAMTIRHRMEQGSEIISTSWIWRMVISVLSVMQWNIRAWNMSTLVLEKDILSWMYCMPMKKHAVSSFHTASWNADLAILRNVMQILPKHSDCLAGRRDMTLMKCAVIPGTSHYRIRMV